MWVNRNFNFIEFRLWRWPLRCCHFFFIILMIYGKPNAVTTFTTWAEESILVVLLLYYNYCFLPYRNYCTRAAFFGRCTNPRGWRIIIMQTVERLRPSSRRRHRVDGRYRNAQSRSRQMTTTMEFQSHRNPQ